jgi:predicted nucleotidyltransferase
MFDGKPQEVELKPPVRAVEAFNAAFGKRLVSVVLFGSRARGESGVDSDWDLLVIAEGLAESYWERQRAIHQALSNVGGTLSLVAKTPEEFESYLAPLYLDVALDGQILFDRDGYASRKLAELRRIITRAGLYRERTAAGDIWRWKAQPVQPWAVQWERDDAAV